MLARHEGLDCLADVCKEHLQLLRTMHAVGLKWAEKFLHEDASLVFRLGYHSVWETSLLVFLFSVIKFSLDILGPLWCCKVGLGELLVSKSAQKHLILLYHLRCLLKSQR